MAKADRALDARVLASLARVLPATQRRVADAVTRQVRDRSELDRKAAVVLGDAFAFIDPVFSSGVWLAMHSGVVGANTVDTCLRQPQRAWGGDARSAGGERPLLGYRAAVTNNMPSNLEKGSSGAICSSVLFSSDWSQLMVAIYGGGIDLTVDRVTLASSGKIRIVAALHAGVAALVPAAFAKMDDAIIA